MKALFVLIATLLAFGGIAVAEERKFPPYPDVWSMEIPEGIDNLWQLQWMRTQNGDVLITWDAGEPPFVLPFLTTVRLQARIIIRPRDGTTMKGSDRSI